MDLPPRSTDEYRRSTIFAEKRRWSRRHSPITTAATLLLMVVVCAAFVYTLRLNPRQEDGVVHTQAAPAHE